MQLKLNVLSDNNESNVYEFTSFEDLNQFAREKLGLPTEAVAEKLSADSPADVFVIHGDNTIKVEDDFEIPGETDEKLAE